MSENFIRVLKRAAVVFTITFLCVCCTGTTKPVPGMPASYLVDVYEKMDSIYHQYSIMFHAPFQSELVDEDIGTHFGEQALKSFKNFLSHNASGLSYTDALKLWLEITPEGRPYRYLIDSVLHDRLEKVERARYGEVRDGVGAFWSFPRPEPSRIMQNYFAAQARRRRQDGEGPSAARSLNLEEVD